MHLDWVEDVHVLRLLGLLIVLAYTCAGALLLVDDDGSGRTLGIFLVLTGCTWLVLHVLRRRRVI